MPSGLLSGGWLAPLGVGGGGGGGPSGVVCTFILRDADGVPTAAIDLSAGGVVRVSTDGGATFHNRAAAAPTSIENGIYTYELDATEATQRYALVQVNKATYGLVLERVEISDAQLAAALVAIENAITIASDATTAAVLATQAHVETHIDNTIANAITTINNHTDVKATDVEDHVDGSISDAMTTTNALITATATAIESHVDASLAPIAADVVSAAIASAVWDAAVDDHIADGSTGLKLALGTLTAVQVVEQLVAYEHDTGVTIAGLLKRLEAMTTGKATHLGIDGTVTFYLRDGVTVAFTGSQTNVLRSMADVSGSENT